MRKVPKAAPKGFRIQGSKRNGTDLVREIVEYELITPLFGGGTVSKQCDEVTRVRATEVRGHLRFWWRATVGAQSDSLETLRSREEAIFGSTLTPSALSIHLRLLSGGKELTHVREGRSDIPINSPKSSMSYVAFPLRDEPGAKLISGVSFEVEFCYPSSLADEIAPAIWAWETFGGLGARTRRGFGAVQRKIYRPPSPSLSQELQDKLRTSVTRQNIELGFPRLSEPLVVTSRYSNSMEAWEFLYKRLRSFRQFRRDKEGEVSSYGSSQWPEPNAIRHRAGRRPRPQVEKFPRAAFGLPIIFDMCHDHLKSTLQGRGDKQQAFYDRLASPLVMRPIQCSDGAVGVALVMAAPRTPPYGLVLTNGSNSDEVQADLTETEAIELSKKLEPLNGERDILEAFLQYLRRP